MSEPEIVVVADREAGAVEAAARIATILADAVEGRARADWATTGGSTPVGIYKRLARPPLVDAVPWAAVQVWWGDDRFVPRDHPLSNVKPFDDILLGIARARRDGRRRQPGRPDAGREPPPVPDRRGDRPGARTPPGARQRSPTSCGRPVSRARTAGRPSI